MHPGPIGAPLLEGTSTLEVRWILPGPVGAATIEWFQRLPAATETREDTYLVTPWLDGLSVKIRADTVLDVKAYQDSPGTLEVPGRARGRLSSWQKWTFPLGSRSEGVADDASWSRVRKVRRISRFALPDDWVATPSDLVERARCAVELTDIVMAGADWWTLGFEASGPSEERRSVLEAAAASVFAEPLPGGVALGLEDSGPYAEWLRHGGGEREPA